jgi:hypothetical protein
MDGIAMRRLVAVIALTLVAGGCRHWTAEPDSPADTHVSVRTELPAGTDVLFSGKVSLFGGLFRSCFVVTKDDASAVVWYDVVSGRYGHSEVRCRSTAAPEENR